MKDDSYMIPAKPSPGERKHLVDAAMGRKPFDLLITNIQLVNVFSGEIYPAGIGIVASFIAFVGDIPSLAFPEASAVIDFADIVIPRGTTTVVTDPHEIANVMGLRGVEYMLEAGRGLLMYQFAMAPSCVPAVPELESSGSVFGRDEMARMLKMDGVPGAAEVMDYKGVLDNSPRISEILDLAIEEDAFIQGHFFGAVARIPTMSS